MNKNHRLLYASQHIWSSAIDFAIYNDHAIFVCDCDSDWGRECAQAYCDSDFGKKHSATLPPRELPNQIFYFTSPKDEWRRQFPSMNFKDGVLQVVAISENYPTMMTLVHVATETTHAKD